MRGRVSENDPHPGARLDGRHASQHASRYQPFKVRLNAQGSRGHGGMHPPCWCRGTMALWDQHQRPWPAVGEHDQVNTIRPAAYPARDQSDIVYK
jgi:hypothetical protein